MLLAIHLFPDEALARRRRRKPPAQPDVVTAPVSPDPAPSQPPAPDPPPAEQEALRRFEDGLARFGAGQYDDAVAAFEAAYGLHPDPVYLYNVAQSHRLAGRKAEAVVYYRRYLQEAPRANNRLAVEARLAELEGPPPSPQDLARQEAVALSRQGRALAKEGNLKDALVLLRRSVDQADAARLDDDTRASLHYALALVLMRAREDDAALRSLRRAVSLSPKDPDFRADLATLLVRVQDYDAAIAEGQAALRLGLSGDDAADVRDLIAAARGERLRQRLSIDAGVDLGYDSNVLQGGTVQTIAGKTTTGTRLNAAQRRQALRELRQSLTVPRPPDQEWDLPLTLRLSLAGRPYGNRRFELWAGYRFTQTFMTSIAYDHDIYNLQEHLGLVRALARPWRFLTLRLRLEGFANFSGLTEFAPFQGGFNLVFDPHFDAGPFRARLYYRHNTRRSFDRLDGAYLDGDRDDAGLAFELRTRYVRPRLGYTFRSDRTGVLQVDVPTCLRLDRDGECPDGARTFTYLAPLSYQGHEAHLSALFTLPLDIEIASGLRYEHRRYSGSYMVLFQGLSLPELPPEQRLDHLISADLFISKDLPRGFSVELGYALTYNLSSIANGLDNRNYTKHVVTASAMYSF